MKGFYTEAEVQSNGGSEDFHKLVRARTSAGEWGSVYVVTPDGGARLWERTTRWEPLKAIRARVNASLGGGKEVRP